jgi:hypothetical protein
MPVPLCLSMTSAERRCLGPETIVAPAGRPQGKIATIPKSLDRTNEGSSTQHFAQALFKPEIPAAFRDRRRVMRGTSLTAQQGRIWKYGATGGVQPRLVCGAICMDL